MAPRPTRTVRVYPRVYGGTMACRASSYIPARSIPACTGEPGSAGWISTAIWVYPRVYGGTDPGYSNASGVTGLSPRVRGNPRCGCGATTPLRSIPACTGEPAATRPCMVLDPVYPRVYGGTTRRDTKTGQDSGLSPRVRGNLGSAYEDAEALRSIPACTGEPKQPPSRAQAQAVYPRVYGGTWIKKNKQAVAQGLSPRVRGNPARASRRLTVGRSIPACTGEPRSGTNAHRPPEVYPRVYGGTSTDFITLFATACLLRSTERRNANCQRAIRPGSGRFVSRE